MSNTAISLALIVEDDGRTTEVVRDGSALEVARTIVRKIDNGDDGKKSFEDKGYVLSPSHAPHDLVFVFVLFSFSPWPLILSNHTKEAPS